MRYNTKQLFQNAARTVASEFGNLYSEGQEVPRRRTGKEGSPELLRFQSGLFKNYIVNLSFDVLGRTSCVAPAAQRPCSRNRRRLQGTVQ